MTARSLIGAEVKVLGTARQSLNSTTEAAFDFGTPNDLYLPVNANGSSYESGDRILVIVTVDAGAGTTDHLLVSIYDADDNAGSIGTPAAAIVDHPSATYGLGSISANTGHHRTIAGVKLQPGRPWLRVSLDASGTTDTFVGTCLVLAIPQV
jgi:hypothetical protein